MTDRKQDIMAATGAHRAWVGERVGDAAVPPIRSTVVNREVARPFGVKPPQVPAGKSRHAAITKTLSNFPNYKTWAEKAKTNWQKDKPE